MKREDSLLVRAKAGDKHAFDELQADCQPALLRFVVRLVGQFGDEYDVVQKSLLSLWVNRQKIESVSHARAFLYRVARNLCYDELRAQGRFDHREYDDGVGIESIGPAPAGSFQAADDAAHWNGLLELVARAMERLSELQRQALILYAEEGLTYAEVAVAMDCDINTVKTRIHHGRKRLVKLLSPEILGELGITKEETDG